MEYIFEPVGQSAEELRVRMLKAGHKARVLNDMVAMTPFEDGGILFEDWVESMQKHFGCRYAPFNEL